MIKINLLPVRQTKKLEAARRELVLALGGGGVVAILCLAAAGFFWIQLSTLKADNRALQSELDQLAADVARVEELAKMNAELDRKLAVIADLDHQKVGPVHMLDELATATPEKLQLTQLQEKNKGIEVHGVSVTNEIISQFLRALDASPYFEQVYLQNIESMDKDKNLAVTVKSFNLTARLVNPKPGVAEAAATPPPGEKAAPAPPVDAGTTGGGT